MSTTTWSPRRAAKREQQARAAARLAAARAGGPAPGGWTGTASWVPDPPPLPPPVPPPSPPSPPMAALGSARRRHAAPVPPVKSSRDGWRRRLADRAPVWLRGARWSVPLTAAVALVAVTGLVALALAVRTAEAAPGVPVPARPGAASTPLASGGPAPGSEAGGSSPTAAPTGSPASSDGADVVVHVVGQVVAPGLVRLPSGSRVHDALARAGGATGEADLSRVNLARTLVDGEQVVVPRPGEHVPAAGPSADGASRAGSGGAAPAPVDLNEASVTDLDTLPGIGPVLAQRIVEFRESVGRFTSVDELSEVTGIGDKLLANLRPLVTV